MKRVFKPLLLFVLLILSISSFAQSSIKNSPFPKRDLTVYGTYQPTNNGFGLAVSYNFIYTSFSHGTFHLPNGGYIRDENKYTVGGIFKGYSLGFIYHTYGEVYETVDLLDYATCKYSIELGVSVEVYDPMYVNMRIDVIQRQVVLGFGRNFNLNGHRSYRPR
jgi:hypothetical protein